MSKKINVHLDDYEFCIDGYNYEISVYGYEHINAVSGSINANALRFNKANNHILDFPNKLIDMSWDDLDDES